MILNFARLTWGVLPASRLKNALGRLMGYKIHPTARISPVLVIRVGHLKIGPNASIGTGTALRGLVSLTLDEGSLIGQLNWISAAPEHVDKGNHDSGRVSLGRQSAVTNRHYIDASGGFSIGEYATMAGVRSTIITHGIDLATNRQSSRGCQIGRFSLVSSNVKMTPGSTVPEFSLVAMGSIVTASDLEPYSLVAGSPATKKRSLDSDSAYFLRTLGPVD